jgi:Ca-activated chloride channel family protein
MLRHLFAHPWLLLALAALPALTALGLWARWRRGRALQALGDRITVEGQLAVGRWGRRLRGLFASLGLLGLGVGLAGPQWGQDWQQALAPGRDLIVVLDVSRSMQAEQPSRLQRAREGLRDLAYTLHHRGGHRVALVVFAGKARLLCPLTHDYDHFAELIEGLDGEVLGSELAPEAGGASGTRIGAGLAEALAARDPNAAEETDVLLLSDGDDPARDGEWRSAAELLRAEGLPVTVVAIGDAEESHRVPLRDGWLVHDGREVRSRLREEPLAEIAEKTRGRLELSGTRALPLGDLYLDLIAGRSQREDPGDALPAYHPRQQWFLLPAFGLLCLGLALPDRPGRSVADLWRGARRLLVVGPLRGPTMSRSDAATRTPRAGEGKR